MRRYFGISSLKISLNVACNSAGTFFGPNGNVFHLIKPRLVTMVSNFCNAWDKSRCENPEYASSKLLIAASAASRTISQLFVIAPAFAFSFRINKFHLATNKEFCVDALATSSGIISKPHEDLRSKLLE